MQTEGILVGSDREQEWLLPWWWHHYSKENNYPVAFADFGMSEGAKAWCAERGVVFGVPEPLVAEKELRENPNIAKLFYCDWIKKVEKRGMLWELRKVWFKKPIALSLSPFRRTVWLDLDCEVRGSLEPLFFLPLLESKFAAKPMSRGSSICEEPNYDPSQLTYYNSGVLLFEQDSPVVNFWVKGIEEGSRIAYAEEQLLAIILAHFKIPIVELSADYNWYITKHGPNKDALILHWMDPVGKEAIQNFLRENREG